MGYVAKLKRGGRTLDLANGRYAVGEYFTPPTVIEEAYTAPGTSANALGGSERFGLRASNRVWMFSLTLKGSTIAEIKRAAQDVSAFLAWAGDEDDPMYLEFNESDAVPTPSWGQDGTLRYEIVHGRLDFAGDDLYSNAIVNAQGIPFCTVTLTIKPYALGLPQVAAQARGAVHHVSPGTTNGRDRGVVIANGETNHFAVPVFGHATWNTYWGFNANARGSENTDKEFVLFGARSAKIESIGSNADAFVSLTLTSTTYVLSFYAKRADLGVVDGTNVRCLFAGAGVSSSYESVGDGWYRVRYSGTASASPTFYGARVLVPGIVVYVDGFQVEFGSTPTPLAHGDMYGCAWSGDPHASPTTKISGYLRIPASSGVFSSASGSLRAVVSFPYAPGGNFNIFYEAATAFRLFYDIASSTWSLTDGTNTVSAVYPIVAGSTYVVHAVWTNARLQFYINGASVSSGATLTVSASAPTYVYLGTNSTPALHGSHEYRDATIWSEPLTTAQVAADYARIAPQVAAGERVSSIPYLWTKDGDGAVDNWDDSSYDNWGVYQGVPGTAPAKVQYYLTGPGSDAGGGSGQAYIGLWITDEFCNPSRILYSEQSGSAYSPTSGGQYRRTATTTTEAAVTASTIPWNTDSALYRFVEGREWFAVTRWRNLTSSSMLRQVLSIGSDVLYGGYSGGLIGTAPYFYNWLLPSIVFPRAYPGLLRFDTFSHYVSGYSAAGSNVDVDFVALFPRPLATVYLGARTVIEDTRWTTDYAQGLSVSPGRIRTGSTGDSLDLAPDKFNVVMMSLAVMFDTEFNDNGPDGPTFARTTITPRYHLT